GRGPRTQRQRRARPQVRDPVALERARASLRHALGARARRRLSDADAQRPQQDREPAPRADERGLLPDVARVLPALDRARRGGDRRLSRGARARAAHARLRRLTVAGDQLYEAEQGLLQALHDGDLALVAARLTDDFLITTAGWIAEPANKPTWLDGL